MSHIKKHLLTMLGYFWVSPGTPLWRFHLPVMIFWVVVMALGVVIGMYPVEYFLFSVALIGVLFLLLCALAKIVFRNNPPHKS